MRLNWPPPWDLVASVLISVLTLIIVSLSPESVLTFSAPLGLLLVILLPGHLLAFCLFPAKDDLDLRRRALLSLGLSAAVAALVGLGLSLTPRGLQPASLATMLSLLALFLAAVSYLRWSALPRRKRSAARSRRSLRNTALVPIPAKNHLADPVLDSGSHPGLCHLCLRCQSLSKCIRRDGFNRVQCLLAGWRCEYPCLSSDYWCHRQCRGQHNQSRACPGQLHSAARPQQHHPVSERM